MVFASMESADIADIPVAANFLAAHFCHVALRLCANASRVASRVASMPILALLADATVLMTIVSLSCGSE